MLILYLVQIFLMSCVICDSMDAIPVIVSVFVFRTITINLESSGFQIHLYIRYTNLLFLLSEFVHPLPTEYFKKGGYPK